MLARANLYTVLHLQPSASASEIRSAYRHGALHAHPDKGGSIAAFRSIALAYEVLSCSASRELYDKQLKHRHSSRGDVLRTKPQRNPAACRTRKRGVSPAPFPHLKRKRAEDIGEESRSKEPPSAPKTQESYNIIYAMKQLQLAVHDLPTTLRTTAISRMPPRVRRELLKYMVNQSASVPCSKQSKVKRCSPRRVRGEDSFTRGTDIRTLKLVHKTTYQVQLRIRHLRMYTKAQDSIDTAIQHHMVLVEARHALVSSGESIWDDPQKFCDIFRDTLKRFGSSIEELGLSMFISMKADDYICRPATITSPVLSLTEAVSMHARLSKARKTSWAHLRAEWILLMQKTQRSRVQNFSLTKVEAIVDMAHLKLLQRRLRQAVSACDRVLRRRLSIDMKAAKAQAQTQRRANKAKARSVIVLRQQEAQKRHEWAARRRWCKGDDLTMDEIIQGFPQHV